MNGNKFRRLDKQVMNVIIFVMILASGSFALYKHKQVSFNEIDVAATVLHQPRNIAAFQLTDDSGKPYTNAAMLGHWTMMFFGFTNCPQLCPTSLAELNKMYVALKKQGIKELPQVVLVSIDPERDSISKIHQYIKAFNPDFVGARGNKTVIDDITKQLGIVFMKTPVGQNSKDYNVSHTGAIMLFNPQGRLYAFFTVPHDANKLAHDYRLISRQG